MKEPFSFINQNSKFKNQYFERTLSDIESNDTYSENELQSLISKDISRSADNFCTGVNYYSVSVNEKDGMSWFIESIKNKLTHNRHSFFSYCFQAKASTNWSLSSILKEKTILKKAVKYKLIEPFKRNNSLASVPVLIIGVLLELILLGVQGVIRKSFPSSYDDIPGVFQNSFLLLILIIAIVIATAIKIIFADRKLQSQEDASNDLKQKVSDYEIYNSLKYKHFINSLYKEFIKKTNFPRFVFIDKYEELDLITKSVLEQYLNNIDDISHCVESWVVCHTYINKIDKPLENRNFNKYYNIRLKPLEYYEKIDLVKKMNLNESYADFSSIKAVCEGKVNEEVIAKFRLRLLEYRSKNPRNDIIYDSFDLLYLFSINTKPYNIFYYKDDIKKALTRKLLRNRILKKILYNGALTNSEFENKYSNLKHNFDYLFELKNENDSRYFRIQQIAYDVFSSDFAMFELQNNEKLHLFWAMFLGDLLDKKVPQFTETRQLISHLLKMGNSYNELGNDEYTSKIIKKLYDYHLLAIDLSIKVCYFSEIIPLIDSTLRVIQTENLKNNETLWYNLVIRIWQLYSILNKPELLDFIFCEISNSGKLQFQSPYEEDLLDKLFFEFIGNEEVRLHKHRLNLFYCDTRNEHIYSVRNYFKTLSAWFCFSLIPVSNSFIHSKLYKSIALSYEYICGTPRVIDRINDSVNTSFIEFDFRILSFSIWSFGIYYSYEYCEPDEFNSLLDLIEKSLDLTFNMNFASLKKSIFSSNYFYDSLKSEVATISIATIALIVRGNTCLSQDDEKLINRINHIIEIINERLNYSISKISSLSDIVKKKFIESIDGLFNLSSLVWLRLDINSLYSFLVIRRVQFISFFQNELEINNLGAFIRKIDLPIKSKNFYGLISNIVLANGYSEKELKSFYFQESTKIVNENNLGCLLKTEFALFIIYSLHSTNSDIDYLLQPLLDEDYLYKYFSLLSDSEFKNYVIRLTNSIKKIHSDEIHDHISVALNRRNELVSDKEIKISIEEWYEDLALSKKIKNGEEINLEEVLSYWDDKKNSWLYPSILNLLLNNGYNHKSSIIDEAVKILASELDRTGNTYLYLAITVSKLDLSSTEKEVVYECIKEEVGKWYKNESIGLLIDIYHILYEYYDFYGYKEKIVNLETHRFEMHHNMRLPSLYNNGNYVQILLDYYELLQHYNLRTEITNNEYYQKKSATLDNKVSFIEKWTNSKTGFPSFSILKGNYLVLNSDFLILAEFLLSKEIIKIGFEKQRNVVNEICKENIPLLFRIIKNLDSLPLYFIKIFDEYVNRSKIANY